MKKILIIFVILITSSCYQSSILVDKKNNLRFSGKLKNNKKSGTWKYYYSNGKIHQKGNYTNDKQNGNWKFYYESGELMGLGKFSQNQQIGLWKWFHKNGNLYTERLYKNGRLIEIKSCFDKYNKIINCGKIINGNGEMIYHDIENETNSIEIFEFKNGIIKID